MFIVHLWQLEEWKGHGKEQYQEWFYIERGQNLEHVLNFNSQTYQIIADFWRRNNLIRVNVKVYWTWHGGERESAQAVSLSKEMSFLIIRAHRPIHLSFKRQSRRWTIQEFGKTNLLFWVYIYIHIDMCERKLVKPLFWTYTIIQVRTL